MKKRMLVLAWVVMGLAHCAFSEEAAFPPEAQEAVERSAALKSYRVELVLEAKEEDGTPFRLEGKLLFQSPSRRRLEIREAGSDSAPQLLVNDGKVEWQHYPQTGVVYRLARPPPTPGPHRPFAEAQPGTVRFIGKAGTEQEPLLRFEALPLPASVEGSPVPVEKIRVDVGERDGLVREMVLLDAQGGEVLAQRFTRVEVDVPTSDKDFAFTPPEGAAVVDMPEEGKT